MTKVLSSDTIKDTMQSPCQATTFDAKAYERDLAQKLQGKPTLQEQAKKAKSKGIVASTMPRDAKGHFIKADKAKALEVVTIEPKSEPIAQTVPTAKTLDTATKKSIKKAYLEATQAQNRDMRKLMFEQDGKLNTCKYALYSGPGLLGQMQRIVARRSPERSSSNRLDLYLIEQPRLIVDIVKQMQTVTPISKADAKSHNGGLKKYLTWHTGHNLAKFEVTSKSGKKVDTLTTIGAVLASDWSDTQIQFISMYMPV